MSKYAPLQTFLERQSGSEVPVRFEELERVLGFPLPPSARKYAAWWSNNEGSHVAVKEWRGAGWRTSRVDVPGERLVFVRDRPPGVGESAAGDGAKAFPPDLDEVLLRRSDLSSSALRLLEDFAEEGGKDLKAAAGQLLNAAARERRRGILDWFAANTVPSATTSAELIREDRDAR